MDLALKGGKKKFMLQNKEDMIVRMHEHDIAKCVFIEGISLSTLKRSTWGNTFIVLSNQLEKAPLTQGCLVVGKRTFSSKRIRFET